MSREQEVTLDPKNRVASLGLWFADGLDPDFNLDPEEAIEVARSRTRMRDFVPWVFPAYIPDYFHLHVCDHIDRVVFENHPLGHIKNLMLFAPPQHGKSHIVSFALPCFWMAHNPELPVLLTSYGTSLAHRNSRRAKAFFESPMYSDLYGPWGIVPDENNWRNDEWHLLDHEGYVFATGYDGRMTGLGFGLAVIDDPIKDWASAQSELIREKLWDWYHGTLITRMSQQHRKILMMTRWHEDDPASRILDAEGNINTCMECGEYMPDDNEPEVCPKCGGRRGEWKVLAYPALSQDQEERDAANKSYYLPAGLPDTLGRKEGAALAPSRYDETYLLKIKNNDPGQMVWNAEYQQNPTAPKGDYFKVGRVQEEDVYPFNEFGGNMEAFEESRKSGKPLPMGVHKCVRFWDLAASEKKAGRDPDWTVGVLLGIAKETQLIWILHVARIRAEPQSVEDMIRQTAKSDGIKVKIRIEQEPGAAGKSLIAGYAKILQGYHVEGRPASGEKVTRAYNFASKMNAGMVRIVTAPWNAPWYTVHRSFPHGKHDDDVDATAGAYNELAILESTYRSPFINL